MGSIYTYAHRYMRSVLETSSEAIQCRCTAFCFFLGGGGGGGEGGWGLGFQPGLGSGIRSVRRPYTHAKSYMSYSLKSLKEDYLGVYYRGY